MSNLAVRYHNDINSVSLKKFTPKELDILMAIMSRMRDRGEDEVTFDFDYLKQVTGWDAHDNDRFGSALASTYKKLIQCHIRIGNERRWVEFVLFTRYAVDLDKQIIAIKVNSEFRFVLNELSSSFTRFELEEFTSLKSGYAKEFYRRMKQFRNTGFWKVPMEEFKRLLDVPEKYTIDKLDAYVFTPILAELGEKYHLEITKLYEKHGRGRPRVSGFEFTFDKSPLLFADGDRAVEAEVVGVTTEVETPKPKPRKDMKFSESRYLDKTLRVYDEKYQRYNYLKITGLERQDADGSVSVVVKNMDDNYKNTMRFDTVRIWDGYFKKYVV